MSEPPGLSFQNPGKATALILKTGTVLKIMTDCESLLTSCDDVTKAMCRAAIAEALSDSTARDRPDQARRSRALFFHQG
ncbi:MAG: hypothetical protein ACFB0E_07420 [Leptolyngbyaceae cyanobacterium]